MLLNTMVQDEQGIRTVANHTHVTDGCDDVCTLRSQNMTTAQQFLPTCLLGGSVFPKSMISAVSQFVSLPLACKMAPHGTTPYFGYAMLLWVRQIRVVVNAGFGL